MCNNCGYILHTKCNKLPCLIQTYPDLKSLFNVLNVKLDRKLPSLFPDSNNVAKLATDLNQFYIDKINMHNNLDYSTQ